MKNDGEKNFTTSKSLALSIICCLFWLKTSAATAVYVEEELRSQHERQIKETLKLIQQKIHGHTSEHSQYTAVQDQDHLQIKEVVLLLF